MPHPLNDHLWRLTLTKKHHDEAGDVHSLGWWSALFLGSPLPERKDVVGAIIYIMGDGRVRSSLYVDGLTLARNWSNMEERAYSMKEETEFMV